MRMTPEKRARHKANASLRATFGGQWLTYLAKRRSMSFTSVLAILNRSTPLANLP